MKNILIWSSIFICLLCAGCTEVVADGDDLVLKSKFYVAVLFPLIGILLITIGIWACIRVLPEVWKSEMDLRWKGKRSKIVIIPVAGLLFLLGTIPRMQYRVVVGPDSVEFRELGKKGKYDLEAIRSVSVIEPVATGKQRRLHVVVHPLEEFYINESEIGTESFEKMMKAFADLMGKNLR
ncbi:MAG: hypothetical protein AB8F34_06005 [Akkermansiaceae bacterium]